MRAFFHYNSNKYLQKGIICEKYLHNFVISSFLCNFAELMETTNEEKAYSKRISRKTLDQIRKGIHNYIVVGRRYRDINYTAKRLAEDMHTNTRYLSAAIRLHYGCNFAELVNKLRVEEAKQMLADPDCTMTMEDISISAGFANRQSFYTAFAKFVGVKPKDYRRKLLESRDSAFEVLSFD